MIKMETEGGGESKRAESMCEMERRGGGGG